MKIHSWEKNIFWIAAAVLVLAAGFLLIHYPKISQAPTENSPTPTPAQNVKAENIEVYAPSINQVVNSPVKISGKAKLFYFEGSFPVTVLDEDGSVLGKGIATAKTDWMVADFVEFSGEINFSKPKGKKGKIIFSKDNPSGLPENDYSVEAPIIFNETSAIQPKGTCAPNLAKCNNNIELCMEQNVAPVCS